LREFFFASCIGAPGRELVVSDWDDMEVLRIAGKTNIRSAEAGAAELGATGCNVEGGCAVSVHGADSVGTVTSGSTGSFNGGSTADTLVDESMAVSNNKRDDSSGTGKTAASSNAFIDTMIDSGSGSGSGVLARIMSSGCVTPKLGTTEAGPGDSEAK
jgi:hypothetical protein